MKGFATILSILSVFILAKFLTPKDFGLVAMASILAVALQTALQISVNQALILKDHPDREDINTAFTINAIRGALMFLIVAGTAYPISVFYSEPLVIPIAFAFSFSLLLSGFESPALVLLEKELSVKKIMHLNLLAQLSGLIVSITIAWATGSYWAMVVGHIINQVVRLVFSYFFKPYFPWFCLSRWKALLSFSVWISLSRIILTISEKFEQVLIGKLLGAPLLGQFNIGNEVARRPIQEFAIIINRGLFPAFSKLLNDNVRLLTAYKYAVSVSTSIALPVGVGIAILAEPIVLITLGREWIGAIPIIQALGGITALLNIDSATKAIFMAAGLTRSIFMRDAALAIIKSILVFLGILSYGLAGVLAAIIVARVLVMVINWLMMKQKFGLSILSQCMLLLRPAVSVACMTTLLIWGLPSISVPDTINLYNGTIALFEIAQRAAVGAVTYITTHILLWFVMGRPLGLEDKLFSIMQKKL
jgi:PST family polysaccharide transporter